MTKNLERIRGELQAALDAFVIGDPEPYKRLWSHAEDVSLMGAFGGRVTGWAAVADRLDRAASQYQGGRYEEFEIIAASCGAELAYMAWLESISSLGSGGDQVIRRRRATQVFRLESGEWRIVHQHSDPLVQVQLPGS